MINEPLEIQKVQDDLSAFLDANNECLMLIVAILKDTQIRRNSELVEDVKFHQQYIRD